MKSKLRDPLPNLVKVPSPLTTTTSASIMDKIQLLFPWLNLLTKFSSSKSAKFVIVGDNECVTLTSTTSTQYFFQANFCKSPLKCRNNPSDMSWR